MKMTKKNLDIMAQKMADNLLCTVGLKNGKKLALTVRRLLRAEEVRRKDLKEV